MTGLEPGSSGIGSDRSANCATTTAQSSANVCSLKERKLRQWECPIKN